MKKRKINHKEEAVTYKNINKQRLRVQKVHQRLANLRNAFQNEVVSEMVRTKPSAITLEKLNIRGMLRNKHLAKSIANQRLSTLKEKLIVKATAYGIEVREVETFYPSSKLCAACGHKKKTLTLNERTYHFTVCLAESVATVI